MVDRRQIKRDQNASHSHLHSFTRTHTHTHNTRPPLLPSFFQREDTSVGGGRIPDIDAIQAKETHPKTRVTSNPRRQSQKKEKKREFCRCTQSFSTQQSQQRLAKCNIIAIKSAYWSYHKRLDRSDRIFNPRHKNGKTMASSPR